MVWNYPGFVRIIKISSGNGVITEELPQHSGGLRIPGRSDTVQCSAVQFSSVQCSAGTVQFNEVQCSAVQCRDRTMMNTIRGKSHWDILYCRLCTILFLH